VNQAEQDVLGADVVVVEHPGLFLSQDDDAPRAVGESFKHARSSAEVVARTVWPSSPNASPVVCQCSRRSHGRDYPPIDWPSTHDISDSRTSVTTAERRKLIPTSL